MSGVDREWAERHLSPWYRRLGFSPDTAFYINDWLEVARAAALMFSLILVGALAGGVVVGAFIRTVRLIGGI